jgi:hypothetical protein
VPQRVIHLRQIKSEEMFFLYMNRPKVDRSENNDSLRVSEPTNARMTMAAIACVAENQSIEA